MNNEKTLLRVKPSKLDGKVAIPGSKSHTIRALICGLCADGTSYIRQPLLSSDTLSALAMVTLLGARVEKNDTAWILHGRGGQFVVPDNVIDVGNSGTALYLGMAIAALMDATIVFTGDAQIRKRSAASLITALQKLGADVSSTRNNGCAPILVRGPLRGGQASIEAVTSQYLTALLLAAPLAKGDTVIDVPLLNEKPYIDITLRWLDRCGIEYEHHEYRKFMIKGRQAYRPFDTAIPADFSSGSFFMVAAAITGSSLFLKGLDYTDAQGDKRVADILREMGARIEIKDNGIQVTGPLQQGGTFDLNAMPDALPILAVAGCYAGGETRLVNVAQARIKETDRITVMCQELRKMGADIEELPDGLLIRQSRLQGAEVLGHGDHRVVMALAIAALQASGETVIRGADAVQVTFPNFTDLMQRVQAQICMEEC